MEASDTHKLKVLALLITLAGNKIDKTALDALTEEVKSMSNAFIEYFEERGEIRGEKRGEIRGEIRGREDVAKNMISQGISTQEIAKFTCLSHDRINEIRKSMQAEAV